MEIFGSTSRLTLARPGVLVKQPIIYLGEDKVDKRNANCFSVERQILEQLGSHPRIVKYLGTQGEGLLLSYASHGSLQAHLDDNPDIEISQRIVWCRQIAEAIAFIHSHGVVHSDLRPKNILVHETEPGKLDLLLCDFGGSVCRRLGLDGQSLPDGPFWNPALGYDVTTAIDIFALGSLFYTILTGRWPYRDQPGVFETFDKRLEWEDKVVHPNFLAEKFPDVEGLPFGDVMMGCWKRRFATADDILFEMNRSEHGPNGNTNIPYPVEQ